jgi:MerR family redox-sensitive transcriptional activator SoxR
LLDHRDGSVEPVRLDEREQTDARQQFEWGVEDERASGSRLRDGDDGTRPEGGLVLDPEGDLVRRGSSDHERYSATSSSLEVKHILEGDPRHMDNAELLTIGQLSTRAGVAASALRFYEDQGLIGPSQRNDSGRRRYTRDTLRRVAFIRSAQRVGLSLEEIGNALATLPDSRTPTPEDWTELSTAWRSRLDERIELLEALRDRLDSCIGCGCLSLERCALYNPDDVAARLGHGPRYLQGDTSELAISGQPRPRRLPRRT